MKRLIALLLCLASLSLCACSSIYEKEYTVVEPFVPAAPMPVLSGDKVTVRSYGALRMALQNMVMAGKSQGSIVFDQDYEGDAAQDLSNACWQLRTENALCAYCVENISYTVSTVLTNDEAQISIVYGDTGVGVEDIVLMPYATALDQALEEALRRGDAQLVVLISYSTYSAATMEGTLTRLYRENPLSAPAEPGFSVSVFSGTGMQKLYDVSIDYSMADAARLARMQELEAAIPFREAELSRLSAAEKLYAVMEYLSGSVLLGGGGSVYEALVLKNTDSEGLALATVALCRRLGLKCQAVYGQKNWQEHCWNIVELDGMRCHLDMSEYLGEGLVNAALYDDQQFWGSYRWDTSAYPACRGSMSHDELVNGQG